MTVPSNRVPAGIPTGGEFATGQRAENDDLAPTGKLSVVERNVAIYGIVNTQMSQEEPDSDDPFTTGLVPIGTDSQGRVYNARVTAHWQNRSHTDTDLDYVPGHGGYWAVSIDGNVSRSTHPTPYDYGDVIGRLAEEPDEMGELGRLAQHINGHTARKATTAQAAHAAQIKAECDATGQDTAIWYERCVAEIADDRGHKWDRGFLLQQIDPDDLRRTLSLIDDLAARSPR